MRGLYWYSLIKICRALFFVRLPGAAEWLANVTGLKARLVALVGES